MTSIWWIRRDVRVHDQPALHAALRGGAVIPAFVLDPTLLRQTPMRRQAFLFASLRALDADLRKLGARLVVRSGPPVDALRELLAQGQADVVFAEEDHTPYARRRDELVSRSMDLRLVAGQTVQHPKAVTKNDGRPYVVYTPYARAWKTRLPKQLTPLAAPEKIVMPPGLASDEIPDLPSSPIFPAGERAGQQRLNDFVEQRIHSYETQRDRMDLEGTSALSPYIRFGILSLRTVVAAALEAQSRASDEAGRRSAEIWLNELIWREFYVQILYHFPQVGKSAFRESLANVPWRNNQTEFDAWKAGQTGVPIVDAAMRQLSDSGWMHNRARMISASYLVKDLLINWQWGERWFMDNLIDGDPSANNGGWQWVAGTGTDAAPYFRIFNPVLQSRKFDPEGHYIRRWVPELAGLTDDSIHAPWEKGLVIPGYPPRPIVEHAAAIRRTRLAYESTRDKTKPQVQA